MKRNGSMGFAWILIACGALILLGKFGHGLGHLMSYVIPVAMVLLGWYSVKRGSRFVGWIILIPGLLFLMGKLAGLIGLLIGAGMVVYGISLLRRKHTSI